ncbi:MAG: DUF1456 family protein [Vallitaleaceae bacterium]|jgi:uncharacterized protein YehS (DUF1456 family)|nr:DUF1456 family protein [Vallitaleaceae bacterium]
MDNNDILIRIRYALDIKNTDMIDIFKLGDMTYTKEEILRILTKSPDSQYEDYEDRFFKDDTEKANDKKEASEHIKCTHFMLESFLNGFIIFKRGLQEPKPGETIKPVLAIKNHNNVNNVMLKKLKIALSLSSEDMLDIFEMAGLSVTKGELGALFRKEGHKNYVQCLDKYARNFLKGLAIKYRD